MLAQNDNLPWVDSGGLFFWFGTPAMNSFLQLKDICQLNNYLSYRGFPEVLCYP